jgi:DnaD/phage-associated family protein|nr:MAG TPA: replisome organizer [Caudoviricetes sp.]
MNWRRCLIKKVNNYFSHDFNARNDIKLKKVIANLGIQGIGLYWCIIECLYENDGYLSFDDIDLLSYELRTDKDLILNLIENFDLFKKNNKNKFYSQSVLNRLEEIESKSRKNRENALKRWNKNDTNEMQTESNSNATALQPQCYIKEKIIKENKRKDNNILLTTTEDNNIYNYVESNFGRTLSPIELEKIGLWSSEYKDEILKYAIQIAVMNRKATFAYVEGILKNWKAKGFETLDEIKENDLYGVFATHKKEKSSEPEIDTELFDYNWLEDDDHD